MTAGSTEGRSHDVATDCTKRAARADALEWFEDDQASGEPGRGRRDIRVWAFLCAAAPPGVARRRPAGGTWDARLRHSYGSDRGRWIAGHQGRAPKSCLAGHRGRAG